MDDEDIRNEVAAITKEIEYAVTDVVVCSINSFYLTTKEGAKFKLRLSNSGLEIVTLDQYTPHNNEAAVIVGQIFETIYSFLSVVSPSYRNLFATSLAQKLATLATKHE